MNVAAPAVLDISELLSRVDNDRELVSELFFIFKSVFPSHLQRLSDAIANEMPKQVQAESHTLKGMLLNLSAARAAIAADLESMGRESKQTSIGPLLVTMSMGVHQTQNWGVRTVEKLLHQVDSAMYAAKAAGRNRISFTKPEIAPDEEQLDPTEAERSLH